MVKKEKELFYKDLFGPQHMSQARLRNDSWSASECLSETE
jgi:hypothetical protein